MTERKEPQAYVRQVVENTTRYAQDLLAENEKLRSIAGSLRDEKLQLEDQLGLLTATLRANEGLGGAVAALLEENRRLHGELEVLHSELRQRREAGEQLERQLVEIEEESRSLSRRYVEVEQQNSDLASLYVASCRLHETLERAQVLETIREIVANLVGSEEFGLFERDEEGETLELVTSMGTLAAGWPRLRLPSSAADPQERLLPPELETARPAAWIPLRLGERVTGGLAIFRLLSHKSRLEPVDHELLDLLATHAATALYCTRLFAGAARGAA